MFVWTNSYRAEPTNRLTYIQTQQQHTHRHTYICTRADTQTYKQSIYTIYIYIYIQIYVSLYGDGLLAGGGAGGRWEGGGRRGCGWRRLALVVVVIAVLVFVGFCAAWWSTFCFCLLVQERVFALVCVCVWCALMCVCLASMLLDVFRTFNLFK